MIGPGPLPAGRGRTALLETVTEDLASLPPGARVVVALSGGPDSTALAYLATEARPDLVPVLVHVRHGLRDDAADVAVVQQHAGFLGLALELVEVEVRATGHGPEAAARDARYAALRRAASSHDADGILVGHTADDLAETVLLRAARGTGIAGLAAMTTRAGDLLRPLLRLRRSDLRRFVELEGLPVAEDPTNVDQEVRRVLVRERVLPALGQVGPDPVGALGRLAALAAEDEAALDGLAAAAVRQASVRCGDVVALRDEPLGELPVAVQRRVWRRVVTVATGGPPPSSSLVAELLALAPGRRLEIGDLEVSAGGGWHALAPRTSPTQSPTSLVVPGATPWRPAAVTLHARTPDADGDDPAPAGQIAFELSGAWTPPVPSLRALAPPPGGDPARCTLTLPDDVGPLELRHRRPGDRCTTAVGTQLVARLLVDAGVPRPVRDRWPLVVAGDRVVWLPGVAADAELLAAGRAAPAVQLVVSPDAPV